MNFRKNLLSFIIGSSIIAGLVSFTYIPFGFYNFRLNSNNTSKIRDIKYEWIMAGVLIILGFANVFSEYIKSSSNSFNLFSFANYFNDIKINWLSSVIVGSLTGLVLSIIGRFIFNFSVDIFKVKGNLIHLYAMILYSLVFTFIISPLSSFIHN